MNGDTPVLLTDTSVVERIRGVLLELHEACEGDLDRLSADTIRLALTTLFHLIPRDVEILAPGVPAEVCIALERLSDDLGTPRRFIPMGENE